MMISRLLLFVFAGVFFFVVPSSAQADTLQNKEECLQVLLSEKYCNQFFPSKQPVEIQAIVSQANTDAASPGGNFTDRIWLSEEMASVAKGIGDQPGWIYALAGILLALFVGSLVNWKNIKQTAHLDLIGIALLFTGSFVVYVAGNLALSVFINALALLVLMIRMLVFSRGKSGGLSPSMPTAFFIVGIVLLLPLRFLFALFMGDVYDPGYSGVVGAKLLLSGEAIYGNFPEVVTAGDTYGPFNYYSYIPFQLLFPLKELTPFVFESLAARWHALVFEVGIVSILFFIGRTISSSRLGAIMVFGYLAFPLSAFHLLGATNDALPVFLMLLSFFFFIQNKKVFSGAALATATMSKFMPGLLAPLFSRKAGGPSPAFFAAFLITVGALFIPIVLTSGLEVFWKETFYLQMTRLSPNSFWGQLGGISPLPYSLLTITLALLGFIFPRHRSPALVAAFAAAILLAYQGSQAHWFYTYFIWSLPFMLIALLGSRYDKEVG